MKNAIVGLGTVFIALCGAWLAVFEATPPCEALATEIDKATQNERAEVRVAAHDATVGYSQVQCALMAVRLKVGDHDALKVVVVDPGAAPATR